MWVPMVMATPFDVRPRPADDVRIRRGERAQPSVIVSTFRPSTSRDASALIATTAPPVR